MPYWRAGQRITADLLSMEPEDWTPDLTGLSIGDGQVEGWRARAGNVGFWGVKIIFGSTTALTDSFRISTPYTPLQIPGTQLFTDALGFWQYRVSGTQNFTGTVTIYDSAGTQLTCGGCWNTASTADGPSHRIGVTVGAQRSPAGDGASGHIITASGVIPITDGT